ncbi:Uncharacterised protein [Sarcina ventriculi]|uniref:hypothetical protein n=1 Tax=Sarcina ventriculi TaxID=1267 RepID=UPI000D8572FF|nr:hypothetical protein [Sarcina ventriculi]SPZ49729.1 Uncharacterised protein [Sarcina ventriculi]
MELSENKNTVSSLKESSNLQNLLHKLEKDNHIKNEHKAKVFIFISIDLVNSTNYKQLDENWPNVFSDFFSIVQNQFKDKLENSEVWKYIGDEILFYQEITHLNLLLQAPSKVFSLMEFCQKKLYDEHTKCKNILYLKSTIWTAAVKKSNDKTNTLVHNIMPDLKESIRDYIGIDIDEGFRIAKFSSQNKLVIDSKLAYILYENKELVNNLCDYNVEDRLKIVGFKKLKGIWNNRLYPIIWYHKNWSNMSSMFLYDEYDTSEICATLKANNFHITSISELKKILTEMNLENKIEVITDIINKTDNKKPNNPAVSKLVELHCVTVCIDPKNNKILIAKRSSKKSDAPGNWEFGCAKASANLALIDTLKNEYKNDFKVDIDIYTDTNRTEDVQPIPLCIYSLAKDGKENKGIIFIATIISDINDIPRQTKKHEIIKFISEDEIDSFSDQAIPDFKDTLKKAFKFYNSRNKE